MVDGFCMLLSVITNEVPPFTTTELILIKKEVELKRVQVEEIEHKHELEPVEVI